MKIKFPPKTRPIEIKIHYSSGIKIKSRSVFSGLLLAGLVLLGPGWGVQHSAAQLFPGTAGDEPSYSIGVFQLTVDPAFAYLFAPHAPGIYYYPGFSPGSGVLTSPMMYDFTYTKIAVSASHVRNVGSPTYFTSPDPGGVRVGTSAVYPSSFPDFIPSYSSYAVLPPDFANAPNGIDEIMTEIESFNLATTTGSAGQLSCSNSDPRVPSVPVSINMVVAGPAFIPGLPQNRRSIGMVQQLLPPVGGTDFPAESFFDIFVDVTLPIVPGNNSAYDFPGDPGIPVPSGYQAGAVLYNDANDPLVIVNTNVTSLPPTAVYIHGVTTAVPLRFKFANPPYWAANDVIGYLVLAGHGVIPNPSNDCAKVAVGVTTLLDQTLGPVGSPMPGMPVPWLRSDNLFPPTNSTYESTVNTVVSGSGTSVLDDTVSFASLGGTLYLQDLVLSGLPNSIALPAANTATTYSASGTSLNCQISPDGVTFYTASASFPGQLQLAISNNGTAGGTATFSTEILQLSDTDASALGTFMLRESPTKQSLGRHTVSRDTRGYRVSSFFDVFLELSTDGGENWIPANRSIRVQSGMPPAMPNSIFASRGNNGCILQWQNEFTLQSTTDLRLPFTDEPGPITLGPFTNQISGTAKFFRLRN